MSRWTEQDLRAYTQKRLRDEERTRTKLYANHTQKLSDMGRDAMQPRPVANQRQESKDQLSVVRCNMQKMPSKQTYKTEIVTAFFREHGIPQPLYEHQFCAGRKWRFDISWDGLRAVAVECNGGLWSGGAHVRPARMLKEYEKWNEAAALGWRVLFVTPDQLMTAQTADLVKRCLNLL